MKPLRLLLPALILQMICSDSIAQKIKYKDLFPVLNSKNYAEGGPKLRQFLSDPKNAEEANPNLQMGLMLEDQFLKYDFIEDSTRIYETSDSAILYFNKSISLIDDKELKKKDEYYQPFFRRDLRTGEFGIKVSDVHLDIEKKIEAIQDRTETVRTINSTLRKVAAEQEVAAEGYRRLTDKYSSYNTMLLAVSQQENAIITAVKTYGANAKRDAEDIKELATKLGSTKYQTDIQLLPIAKYGEDGLTQPDIMTGEISMWDYESWGLEAQSSIRGSIGLFKNAISKYVKELRTKKSRLKDSQTAEGLAVPSELLEMFQKYDPTSTAEVLLRVETFEARVIKQVDLQINPDLMDSSLVGSQLKIYSEALSNVDSMNSLVRTITPEGLQDMKVKYRDYSDSFKKKYLTASKYVEDMKEWSSRNKDWITNSVEYWKEKDKWGIIAKEGEEEREIRLEQQDVPQDGFKTIDVLLASIDEVIICGANTEAQKGYIGAFGEDRYEKWMLEFDLPGGLDSYSYTYNILPCAEGFVSFYLYNPNEEENNFSAVNFSPSGSLKWAVTQTLPKEPLEFKFDDLTQELTILMYPEEELPLDSEELGYLVIDRNGNPR